MGSRQQPVSQGWRQHLAAAAAAGQTISAYAKAQGVNRKSLYTARRRLRETNDAVTPRAPASAATPPATRAARHFVPVRVAAARGHAAAPAASTNRCPALRAVLPNGIVIECGPEVVGIDRLLTVLIGLPCSGSMRS